MLTKRTAAFSAAMAMIAVITTVVLPTGARAQDLGVQARPADAFVDSIGVNTHLHYSGSVYKDLANVQRVLTDAGIRHIRDYPVNMTAIAQLAKVGVRTSAIIGHPDQGSWGLPIDTYFQNILKAPQAFSSIEGTNEPDITMGADWASKMRVHQKDIWNRVKGNQALSHLPVAAPSLTWAKNAPELGDVSASVDWGNVHPYPGGRTPDKRVQEDVSASKLNNVAGKPVIATETGYHTALASNSGHRPATEAAEGTYIPRLWLGYYAMGVPRSFSYELLDQGSDQTQSEKTFGLLRNDFSPKPAYTATKNLISLLADPGGSFGPGRLAYTIDGGDAATRQVLLQKRDGTFWLAVWQETSVWDEVNKVTLNPPDRALTLRLGTASDVRAFSPNLGTAARSSHVAKSDVAFTGSEQVTLLEIRSGDASTTSTTSTSTTSTTTAPTAPTAAPSDGADGNLLSTKPALIDGATSASEHRWLRRSGGSTTGSPAITTASSEVLEGTASLKQTKDGSAATNWDAWQSAVGGSGGLAVTPATTYTFTGELRLPDAPSNVQAIIEWFDSSGKLVSGAAAVGPATAVAATASTAVSVTGTAPAGAAEARLIHRVSSVSAGGRVLADRFSFTAATSGTTSPSTTTTTTTTTPPPTAPPATSSTNLLSSMRALIDGAETTSDHGWVRRSNGSISGDPAVTAAGGEVLHGSASLIQTMDRSAAKNWDAWQTGAGPVVTPGTTYTFRGELRLPDAPSSVRAIIEWFDSSGKLIRRTAVEGLETPVGSTGSTEVSVTGKAPAGAARARLIHRVASVAAHSRVIGDRFSFHTGASTGFPTS